MFEPSAWIKIITVPSGDEDDRIARQEFKGLVLPTVTSNGQLSGYYVVYLVDVLPIISVHKPLLAEWLEQQYPADGRQSNVRLIFEAEVCQEVAHVSQTSVYH